MHKNSNIGNNGSSGSSGSNRYDGTTTAREDDIGGKQLVDRAYPGDYREGIQSFSETFPIGDASHMMEKLYELEANSSANAISALSVFGWDGDDHLVERKAHIMKEVQIQASKSSKIQQKGKEVETEIPTIKENSPVSAGKIDGSSSGKGQADPAASERLKRYESGACKQLMVSFIQRCKNKNIHASYRLEALQSLWDLTRDATLLELLHVAELTLALLIVLAEFCPKSVARKTQKVEGELDCARIVLDEEIPLGTYLEQEFIRCMALLALCNLSACEKVQKYLILPENATTRAQIIALCSRHMRNYGNESLYALDSHFQGAVAEAMTPKSLATHSNQLIARMLGALQAEVGKQDGARCAPSAPAPAQQQVEQDSEVAALAGDEEQEERRAVEGEMNEMHRMMTQWQTTASSARNVGVKRSFIKSTRIIVC